MKGKSLTIRKPQELAVVIKANINMTEIRISEGKVIIEKGGSLLYFIRINHIDANAYEVINAYKNALQYELKGVGILAHVI